MTVAATRGAAVESVDGGARAPFDAEAIPLGGTTFIEASAGTGKTFALTSLYLRLIAERGLRPAEILVVTFTKTATAELRERIRSRLRDALAAETDVERALRLRRALRDFDEAAIFTIHGFCQRTLQESAFESALSFDVELVEKPERLQRTLAHDLFSALLAPEDPGFRHWLLAGAGKRWTFEPDSLYGIVADLLGPDDDMPIQPSADEAAAAADASALSIAADRAWRRFADCWRARWGAVEAVLADPETKLNRRKYPFATIRSKWAPALARACEEVEEAASPSLRATLEPPAFIAKYLTTEQIVAGMNQGGTAPRDELFDVAAELVEACRALDRGFDAKAVGLRRRFVDAVREASSKRRSEQHVLFFDDLLAQLRAALRAPDGGALVARLRARYRFALIDEFQDTDAVQYDIFRTLWHGPDVALEGGGLFLIGDPKQAIYSFRGADVETYLTARADAAGGVHRLDVNHRSDPAMVEAVNALFGASARPFAQDAIGFQPVSCAARPDRPSYRAEERFAAGLRVLLLSRDGADEVGDVGGSGSLPLRFARTRWMNAMARDVAELLESGAEIGERRIAPSDVAILARRKSELEAARRALEALGIPCVSRGEGDVFDSREAWELASLIAAWLRPGHPGRLRAALSTGAHGFDARALRPLSDDSAPLADVAERFAEYGRIWSQRGFGSAFATWRAREGVDERLLAWGDGDRRLTNWLHLAELLARIEGERNASRTGLARWLDRAIADASVREELGDEASLLRLERDDQAVQLVTLHGAKGLEYEVVYLPSLWESFESKELGSSDAAESNRRPPVRFHDPSNGRRTLDLGAELAAYNAHRAIARAELSAEHLRLLYVGLTRARRLCVVLWGRIGSAYAKSPLARLVLGAGHEAGDADAVAAFLERASALDDSGWAAAWHSLSESASEGAIRIEPSNLIPRRRWSAAAAPPDLLPFVPPRPLALQTLVTTSFSALVRGATRATASSAAEVAGPMATGRDLDADAGEPTSVDAGSAAEASGARAGGARADDGRADAAQAGVEPADLAAEMDLFPRGAEAGTLLHEVLEHVDLAAVDEVAVRRLAAEGIARSPLGSEVALRAVAQVVHVVRSVARTPLRREPTTLRLADVARGQILPELEFTLAAPGDLRAGGFSPASLAQILADARAGSPLERYAERAAALSWPALSGYLRGFIDAVFCDGERWFVVDYKSNHLGSRQRDYFPDRLVAPMIDHDYVLQYLLYTVALHRHLAARLADYDYERHFGGAYYLFLRGMAESHPPGCGIFFDRPEAGIVGRVSALLGAAGAAGAEAS